MARPIQRACHMLHVMFLLVLVWSAADAGHAQALSEKTLIRGSRGEDVYELQDRLKHLGLYKGAVDGVFGWNTYWSVRTFQDRHRLPVTGQVDGGTRRALLGATRDYRPRHHSSTHVANGVGRFSANDIKLMANAVYGEARGEPYIGQVAVAAVILNRLEDPRFPKTIPAIIFQPGAFTAVADGQIWLTPNDQARKAVMDAIRGWDPTGGAVYYFNPATATSKWMWSRPQVKRIGKHIFTR
ncbi:MAG: spore cortex-lytic enzyme [Alicyclobacillaceae bacterium]|nr:spore cortex-lytic enzyme [Alicyclobacillaceae bacterium]